MDVKHTIAGAVTALGGVAVSVLSTVVANPSCVPSEYQGLLPIVGAVLSVVGIAFAAKGPSVASKAAG